MEKSTISMAIFNKLLVYQRVNPPSARPVLPPGVARRDSNELSRQGTVHRQLTDLAARRWYWVFFYGYNVGPKWI
jgi:hypothetical protein